MFKKMSAKGSGGVQPPTGTSIAICYGIVDVGFQEMKNGTKEVIYLLFELPYSKMEDGRPLGTNKMYTASMHPQSNLRADLETWFGKRFPSDEAAENFDLAKVAGRSCQLNMVANGSFVNAQAIMGLPPGMPPPARHNEIVIYSMDANDQAAYDRLPEWMQKKIDAGRAHSRSAGSNLSQQAPRQQPTPPPQEWRVNAPKMEPAGPDVGDGPDNLEFAPFDDSDIPFN